MDAADEAKRAAKEVYDIWRSENPGSKRYVENILHNAGRAACATV